MPTTFERPATTGGTPSGSSAVSGEIPAGSRGDVTEVVCGFRPTVVSVTEIESGTKSDTIRVGEVEISFIDSVPMVLNAITLTDNGFCYTQKSKAPSRIYYTAMP